MISISLRELIDQKGVKVTKLAEEVGITYPGLFKILKGNAVPKEKTLLKIARSLDVPPRILLSRLVQVMKEKEERDPRFEDLIDLITEKSRNSDDPGVQLLLARLLRTVNRYDPHQVRKKLVGRTNGQGQNVLDRPKIEKSV